MKIRDDCTVSSSEFWYDLAYGGYLQPEEILENQEDIDRVNEAIRILVEFEESCGEQIEGFIQ